MGEPWTGHAIVLLLGLQRILEMAWARSNARRLVAAGATAVKRDVTGLLVGLHVAWFALVAAERLLLGARMPESLAVPGLVAFAAVEALRAWTLATLGRRWTIRVVVSPREVPVREGPYRFLKHPNYVVVASEVLLVAVWVGAWRTAAVTAVPLALSLRARIRREEEAWRTIAGTPLGAAAAAGRTS